MVPFKFFVDTKKSLNVRFVSRHILFGAFMAKDLWHGVIWQNFLPTIHNLTCQSRLVEHDRFEHAPTMTHLMFFVNAKKVIKHSFYRQMHFIWCVSG